mmetsp:Transcript_87916/g.246965  ORF Transcript_87916/g.246965 Transcript_87916/m.246965 type:complete len:240 (-) Transcript_87916:403-1122(-)
MALGDAPTAQRLEASLQQQVDARAGFMVLVCTTALRLAPCVSSCGCATRRLPRLAERLDDRTGLGPSFGLPRAPSARVEVASAATKPRVGVAFGQFTAIRQSAIRVSGRRRDAPCLAKSPDRLHDRASFGPSFGPPRAPSASAELTPAAAKPFDLPLQRAIDVPWRARGTTIVTRSATSAHRSIPSGETDLLRLREDAPDDDWTQATHRLHNVHVMSLGVEATAGAEPRDARADREFRV